MVFTVEAGSAEKAERDVTELYRALARLLNQDIVLPEPPLPPVQMQAELEAESFLDVEVLPALELLSEREQAQLIGLEQKRLRGLEPLALEGNAPLLLQAAEVRLQIGEEYIVRPLIALPHTLEVLPPEKMAVLRAAIDRPALPQNAAGIEVVEAEILDVELNGVQRFHQNAQGLVTANVLYPSIVEQNAIAINEGNLQVEPQQLRDQATYLLENYTAPTDDGSRVMSLTVDDHHELLLVSSPQQGLSLRELYDGNQSDFYEAGDPMLDYLRSDSPVLATNPSGSMQTDVQGLPQFNPSLANQAYGVLQQELERQVEAQASLQSRLLNAASVFAQPDVAVVVRTAYYNLQITADDRGISEISRVLTEDQNAVSPVLTRQADSSYLSLAEDLEPLTYGLEQQAAATLEVNHFGAWDIQQTQSVEQYYRALPNQLLEQASEDICGIRMPLASSGAGLDREPVIAAIFDQQGSELKERSFAAANTIARQLDPEAQQDVLELRSEATCYELYRPYEGDTEIESICVYAGAIEEPFITIRRLDDEHTLPNELEGLSRLTAQLEQLAVEPQMELRPIGEIEAATGVELGDLAYLHGEVVAEAPVVLVQVDDQGRLIITAPVVAHVEAVEDEVVTEVEERERHQVLPLVVPSSMAWEDLTAISDYLECHPDIAIAEDGSSGLTAAFDGNNLLRLQTPAGRTLVAGLEDAVQTDFTPADFQALASLAQKTTLAMAITEASIDAEKQFERDRECE